MLFVVVPFQDMKVLRNINMLELAGVPKQGFVAL